MGRGRGVRGTFGATSLFKSLNLWKSKDLLTFFRVSVELLEQLRFQESENWKSEDLLTFGRRGFRRTLE